MVNCPKCSFENPEGANFCSNCGEPLGRSSIADTTRVIPAVAEEAALAAELSPEDMQAVEALPETSALLIVERGPGSGARFLLNTDLVTAGRHPDSDIFLDDITVSRHHMKFERNDGIYSVTDLGSLNGTYVNRKVLEGSLTLRTGDEVQIGKFRMIYFSGATGQA